VAAVSQLATWMIENPNIIDAEDGQSPAGPSMSTLAELVNATETRIRRDRDELWFSANSRQVERELVGEVLSFACNLVKV